MTTFLVVLALQWGSPEGPSVRPDQRAAMIAYLRYRETLQGKAAHTQQPLRGLRGEVVDPLFAAADVSEWAYRSYQIVLQVFPVILLVAVVGGAFLVGRCWRRNRLGTALAWCVVWFALLTALHLLVRADDRPAAVVRVDGVVLRQGNGLSYPPHVNQGLPIRLAAGVEALVRTRRANGWVQLELPGGKLGWVPQDAVYLVEARP
jgi:hypothetical protein